MAVQKKGSRSSMDRAGLMNDVELAIGVPVMLMLNIHMDLDIANEVCGIIEGIVLDEREHQIGCNERSVQLHYYPRYVTIKLLRTKAAQLSGLAKNVILIPPITKTFTLMKDGN
jgi:hypothetical protein